jgi:hypothetical protein
LIAWPTGANTTLLQETGIQIGDAKKKSSLRSGKTKYCIDKSSAPDTYSIVMQFTATEKNTFVSWFKNQLRYGTITHEFPTIGGTGTSEYRITDSPKFTPIGGVYFKCTMTWEAI